MSIYILDDDVFYGQKIKELVEKESKTFTQNFGEIFTFTKYRKLFDMIEERSELSLYFLDIELKENQLNGLDVAKEIRKYDQEGLIVFITSHGEYAPISYQYLVSALTFIEKNQTEIYIRKMICKCLEEYQKRINDPSNQEYIVIENELSIKKIPSKEIEVIETVQAHRLVARGPLRRILFYGTLKEMEAKHSFLIKCNQSCLVNMRMVRELDTHNRWLLLMSGDKVEISRRNLSDIKHLMKEER
ncbi:LytR/AlgR family response regulator transcription factor [Facklamia lactis]|uniref:LytR/AlgR family response regulator transcription factor n=1 Tax=Facklamia lactis TaxID=2749967 RepID=UPI0018CCF2AF|nr:response regulator transcription factor [Facklamia lactis]MBG9980936.1 response regulator transcription factor [Facklamia lactis]